MNPADTRARFVSDGHLVVRTDLPSEFHQAVYAKIDEVFDKEGNVGNNILPRVPELQQVYDDPAVAGALTSLLGPGYIMNPHRHCHLNPPGSPGQSWHKDCYVFDHNWRHPRFHWVLAFYYPQDTTLDMGPTGVLPGQQWYRTISTPDPKQATEREEGLIGQAGTVSIVHFDAWHRATANTSQNKRYMLKFQFARTTQPQTNGGAGDVDWSHAAAVSDDVHRWLSGEGGRSLNSESIGDAVDALRHDDPQVRAQAADRIACSDLAGDAADQLAAALHDDVEAVRLNAAYGLAQAGGKGSDVLREDLKRETLANEALASEKTADNAHGTNPTAPVASHALAHVEGGAQVAADLLDDEHWLVRAVAVDALGNMGDRAAELGDQLLKATADEHWWVRRNALEALPRLGPLTDEGLSAAAAAIDDEDYRVRRNAALAVRAAGRDVDETVPALQRMLQDENRYNRFYAVEALRSLAPSSAAAEKAVFDHLITSRWCPLTNAEDLY